MEVYCFPSVLQFVRASRWKDQLTLSKKTSSLYIRFVCLMLPNLMMFLDDSSSDEDSLSNVPEEEFSVVNDVFWVTVPHSTTGLCLHLLTKAKGIQCNSWISWSRWVVCQPGFIMGEFLNMADIVKTMMLYESSVKRDHSNHGM